MNVFKKIYCRAVQANLKVAAAFLRYRHPVILNRVGDIPRLLIQNGKKHPLIVTGKNLHGLGVVTPLKEALKEAGISFSVYDKTVANPTTDSVFEALKTYKEEGCDCLIGFGGGSPMDCAKCVGALIARPEKSPEKLGGVLKVRRKIPLLIAVPTTAGSGSETTPAAVIVDSATRRKYAITDFNLIPDYAVLDESVLATLPGHVVVATGMDALTHAVEAFIGRGGNRASRSDAQEAVKLILENLESAYKGNAEVRKNMLYASHLAGRAFSRAYVGYVHALAHPLGGKYDIAHGLANAVILPLVLREYGKAVHKKLHTLAVYCNIATESDEHAQGADKFIGRVEELNGKFGIGQGFAEIREEDVAEMARYAHREANPLYPVPVLWDRKKLEEIYRKLKSGSLLKEI